MRNSKKKSIIYIGLVLSIFLFSTVYSNQKTADKEEFNILDYGAVADGKTLNTEAIQKSIDDAYNSKNGKVIIPQGKFLSGSIVLKSNVELYLSEGAVLLGTTDPYVYIRINGSKSLILADEQDNIAISGKGTIDGQGRKLALNIDSLYYAGKLDMKHYNQRRKRPGGFHRPRNIDMVKCSNIVVSGVTIKNAANWVQNYDRCTNLNIDSIVVYSDAYWNNDGIDISDCKNVRITNSYVNSADDGICLKSERPDAFNDNIYIANCRVRSSASAIKFGTASHGGFKNVKIENIKVFDTFRSAIAIESVDGGILENIEINNVSAVNTGNAIFIRLGHRNVDGKVGSLNNVHISNVSVQVPFDRPDKEYDIRGPELEFFHNPFPASITGIKEHYVENVVLENIEIIYPGRGNKGLAILPLNRLDDVPEVKDKYPEFSMFFELPAWALYVRHVKGLTLKNISVKAETPDYRPAFVFDDVKGVDLSGIVVKDDDDEKKQIIFKDVKNSKLDSSIEKYVRKL